MYSLSQLKGGMNTVASKPRILVVGPGFSGGGAERRFINVATHLFGGTADIAVLVGGGDIGVSGNVINLGWKGRLSYVRAIWRLMKIIKHERYRVLMAFGLFPSVISILASKLVSCNTKVIVNEITRPKMESENNSTWRMLTYNAMRKWIYPKSDLITANSIDGLAETCELANVELGQAIRVVNAVDSKYLVRKSAALSEFIVPKRNYVICIGRLDFMKRMDTVIESFDLTKDKVDSNLVIVGDGEARMKLEQRVVALGLQKSVLFAGKLENPFPLLRAARAFILASEYEGFSNSVLEAMFCDIPVITSYCSSDALEMCSYGAARGFEVGNVIQLSDHIVCVLQNESVRERMINEAQKYRVPHELGRAISSYEEIIMQVCRPPHEKTGTRE